MWHMPKWSVAGKPPKVYGNVFATFRLRRKQTAVLRRRLAATAACVARPPRASGEQLVHISVSLWPISASLQHCCSAGEGTPLSFHFSFPTFQNSVADSCLGQFLRSWGDYGKHRDKTCVEFSVYFLFSHEERVAIKQETKWKCKTPLPCHQCKIFP